MKFWVNENIPCPLSKALERAGYKVFLAPARSSDPTILRLAIKENAVILTRDQDPTRTQLWTGHTADLKYLRWPGMLKDNGSHEKFPPWMRLRTGEDQSAFWSSFMPVHGCA